MKKLLLKFSLTFLLILSGPLIFSLEDYTIDEIYVELDIGIATYYAETSGTGMSSFLRSSNFGKVNRLYKKAWPSDIGYGKFAINLRWITDEIFAIEKTPFLLEIRLASQFSFISGTWILDTTSGYNGRVYRKQQY
ncbi:MAG: hypothetical protein FWD78_03040 [Treponema sp.]|nr:hypothetical protein [Treponema sp.]